MTPLQECIAECGVNAPLYTVPSEQWPKPQAARYSESDSDSFIWVSIGPDTGLYRYSIDGKHAPKYVEGPYMPDIAPVMPKPGERWVTGAEGVVEICVGRDGNLWAYSDKFSYPVNQWGRDLDADPSFHLILPYIQPHD